MEIMQDVGVFGLFQRVILTLFLGFFSFAPVAFAGELAGEIVSVDGSVFVRADGRVAGKLKPAKPGDSVFAGDVVNTPSNGRVKILMKDKSIVDLGPSALFKVEGFKLNNGTDREADVSMMYGMMRAAITQKIDGKGRFRVKTPAATMGVRGTEFIVKSEIKNMDEIRHVILNPDKPLPQKASPQAQDSQSKGRAPGTPEAAKTEITVLQGQVDVRKELPKMESGRGPASVQEAPVVSLTAGTQLVASQTDVAPLKPVVLDTKQLASITNDVKMLDNTFEKSVVIDTSSNAAGNEIVNQVVAAAVSAPPVMPISMGDVGVAGTFGVVQTFIQQPVNHGPAQKTLRVVIRRLP